VGIRINTNIEALNAQRNLSQTAASYGKSVEKLSSGLRINRAADDAAGLTISEKLRGQVRGLNQASRNAQDAISMVQTAEGALNEVHSILQRVRELVVQRSNGTIAAGSAAETAINDEITSLVDGAGKIISQTKFNDVAMIDADAGAFDFQVGANSGDTLQVTFTAVALTMTSAGGFAEVDADIDAVSSARSGLGAAQNTLEHTIANLGVAAENLAASESRIRDLDVAAEMVSFTKSQILQQAGTAILAQANQAPQSVLSLLK
jgi:flagellin